jgi:hypothetical protein
MARHRQNENIAAVEFQFDLPLPIGTAGHVRIGPDRENAVLHCRLEMLADEAEPPDLAVARALRLVHVAVADKDDRPV